ncbi:MAG: hypothetical protein FP820_11265 [Sulfurimonas sp.]|jgi:hypothetical protein|nr:hypothetical protein [Sulfurimonas sp.]MBU3938694.1 hypothetical protein [bacterium]MBU4024438.1 hypothetical protein [bacterium]MBU4058008.1 hypothetical protein [bacterium]MBU4109945.1 hypothetical protein [bacterium]
MRNLEVWLLYGCLEFFCLSRNRNAPNSFISNFILFKVLNIGLLRIDFKYISYTQHIIALNWVNLSFKSFKGEEMKILLKILTLSFVVLLMGGCSSSTDGSSESFTFVTGQFVDDPVEGLTYECSSGAIDVTGVAGEYTCENGDNVTFSIGGVLIGTVTAEAGIVTPYTFFPNDLDAAINLARLLQSVDTNTSDNVITLDSNLVTLLGVNTDFTSQTFEADVENDLNITLVSIEDAQTQLNETIVSAGEVIPAGANIPVANAGLDQNVHNGDSVTLNGSVSSDADGDSLTYAWSITSKPGSSNATLSDSTVVNPSFTADESGIYVIQLIVNDGSVNSAPDEVNITATFLNAAPVADAGLDQNVNTTDIVELNGSGSTDVDTSDTLTYSWTITTKPTESIATLSDATIINPTFTADLNGTYEVQLIVNDGTIDSAPDTVLITASTANSAPVANAGADQYLAAGSTVGLDGSGSTDANSDSLTYLWSMTSKPSGSNAVLSSTTAVNPTFVADVEGSYVLNLVVNDGTVNSDNTDTVLINSILVAPVSVHNGIGYNGVVSPYTGRIWLDKNLGAVNVCGAYNDTGCYGDYYQWGRGTDGHQLANSATSSVQLTEVNSTSSSFITRVDWVDSATDDTGLVRILNWSKTDGTSVCPVGYRVPTRAEITIETTAQGIADNQSAYYSNFLLLPSSGSRSYSDGSFDSLTYAAQLWLVDVDTAYSSATPYTFSAIVSGAGIYSRAPGQGFNVRCIKSY